MKRLVLALALALSAGAAYAACTSHVFYPPSGSAIVCTTCCYGGNCTTVCN